MAFAGYVFCNSSPHAGEYHAMLGALLDPVSTVRTQALLNLTGKRCLEVGAGGGSFAHWLATRVGPAGTVLALDVNLRPMPEHSRLAVLKHDITIEPIPEAGSWDLVHARLLLNHLPERREVLHHLAGALAPDGVLLTEDWWSEEPASWVASAPDPTDWMLLRDYHAAVLTVLDYYGCDRGWSARAHGAMVEEGLAEVQTTVTAKSWRGESPGMRVVTATLAQLREDLVSIAYLTPDQLDRVQERLASADVVVHGHRLYSTSGRRRSAG